MLEAVDTKLDYQKQGIYRMKKRTIDCTRVLQ